MQKFEWGVVGSGIAGIIAAEILTRENHSTVLIEKNDKLASGTTRDFHEWIHTGSLYTLVPDNLLTLKYLLGSIDDLLEYYSSYERMNLMPTEKGLELQERDHGWFYENHMHFRYRIKGRKITLPWLLGVARSIYLIDRIKEHDWLRRRAGLTDPFKLNAKEIFCLVRFLATYKDKFYDYVTPDFTTNSRNVLRDLVSTAMHNGLYISNSNELKGFTRSGTGITIEGTRESFEVKNLVLCIGEKIREYIEATVKTSYAPMAVVANVEDESDSFVELDYFPKNCINIIKKGNGIGLVGGVSFPRLDLCESYIDEVIKKHRQYNPGIEVLHKYVGVKNEVIVKDQPRNYLYHIMQIQDNVWSIVPGKFTLGFSIGPEFYRRVYKKNPRKFFTAFCSDGELDKAVSNTVWYDVSRANGMKEIS